MKKTWLMQWVRIYKCIRSIGPIKTLLMLLVAVLIAIVMLRNDYSLREDLYRLFVFTTCAAVWGYLIHQKRCGHA